MSQREHGTDVGGAIAAVVVAGAVEAEEWPSPAVGERIGAAVREQLENSDVLGSFLERIERPSRPVVLDANMLRGEIRVLASHDTALLTLARIGFVRLFAARHVLEEVDEHAERWAAEAGVELSAYRAAWSERLRPHVTEVEFGLDLLTPDERARIDLLARPPAEGGDPDDVPTAVAAMVLEAPVLTGDGLVLEAVYGPDNDPAEHAAYVKALFGAGQVAVMSHWGHSATTGLSLVVGATASGVRAVTSRTGVGGPLAGAVFVGALAALSPAARAWMSRAAGPLRLAGLVLLEVYAHYTEAEAAYARLMSPLKPDFDTLPSAVAEARSAASHCSRRTRRLS